MNLGDIKRRVQNSVGDEAGVYIEGPDLVDYANDGQMDIARKTEILQTTALISTIINTDLYALPADLIRIVRVTYLNSDIRSTTLNEISQLDIDKDVAGNTGIPSLWYQAGNKIGLYPTPSAAVANSVKVTYVKSPVALAADADIPEIPVHMHEDIVRFCIWRAKEQDEDIFLLSSLAGEYEKRVTLSQEQAENYDNQTYPSIRDIDATIY